jgi:F0F1-type ATP synthase membrane subunit b/b'
LEQAKVAANEEAKKTKELLVKELAALSALRAEILLKENLDSERQEKLIEECLRKMEGLS